MMNFDEDRYWERVRESMESFPEDPTNIKELMQVIEIAMDNIRAVCKTISCKECLYHDKDGCALKVKEWNA